MNKTALQSSRGQTQSSTTQSRAENAAALKQSGGNSPGNWKTPYELGRGLDANQKKRIFDKDAGENNVPFKSDAQRKWMFANEPELAKRWAKHTPKGKKLPEHVKKSSQAPGEIDPRRVLAYKVGFLAKLAELGVAPGELHERLTKAALLDPLDVLARLGEGATNVLGQAGQLAWSYGAPAAILGPVGVGGLLGYLRTKATSPTDADVKALQSTEELGALRRATQAIRRRMALRHNMDESKAQGGAA